MNTSDNEDARPRGETTQRQLADTGTEPADEDAEMIDEEAGLTKSGFMGMVGKNIHCDECGESSFRIEQGVDSNRCRHCGNLIEDAWGDDDE